MAICLEAIHSTIVHSSTTVFPAPCYYTYIVIKLEIIIKVIKIMIKSERIFVLKEVTVYQVDTVKSNEKTSLVIEASFHKT